MSCETPSRKNGGFTIVELLVVIVIIGALFMLLLPAIQYARTAALRSGCQSNLRQVGLAMTMYLDRQGYQPAYPDVAQLPSVTPDKPTIADVLAPYTEESNAVFACPQDTTYFPEEGVSFEYPARSLAGRKQQELEASRSYKTTYVLFGFDDFHGPNGQVGSRNALYADGHVDSY